MARILVVPNSSPSTRSIAQLLQGTVTRDLEALSVGLVEPVNIYSQADRACKYGLPFVDLALAIFFLLLLSLSEHMAFWIAYLCASVACIGLLGAYLSAVLRSTGRGIGFAAILTALYAALYGLLGSEDNALVLGSLLLFAILAAAMLVTRRID